MTIDWPWELVPDGIHLHVGQQFRRVVPGQRVALLPTIGFLDIFLFVLQSLQNFEKIQKVKKEPSHFSRSDCVAAGIDPPESFTSDFNSRNLTNPFQFESFIHCGWNFTQESAGINPPESFRRNLSLPTSTAATYPINMKVSSTVDEITAMHFMYKKWPLDCASMENGNQQMRPNGRP